MVKRRKGWADPGTGGVDDLSDQDTEPCGHGVSGRFTAPRRKGWLGARTVGDRRRRGLHVRRRWAALRALRIVFASGPGSRVKVACG